MKLGLDYFAFDLSGYTELLHTLEWYYHDKNPVLHPLDGR